MNLRWLATCAGAEAVGMVAAAVAARAADGVPTAVGFGLVVAGGLVEGTALGLAQATVLGPLLGVRRRAWVLVTVVVAGIGWAAGSAPTTLGNGSDGPAPALGMIVLGAAGLGMVMGAVLGLAQGAVLRHHVRHPWRWVTANALGWAVAMAVIFAGASTAGASWSLPALAGWAALTGALAGLGLGAVTGVWLGVLDGPPLRHRLFLRYGPRVPIERGPLVVVDLQPAHRAELPAGQAADPNAFDPEDQGPVAAGPGAVGGGRHLFLA